MRLIHDGATALATGLNGSASLGRVFRPRRSKRWRPCRRSNDAAPPGAPAWREGPLTMSQTPCSTSLGVHSEDVVCITPGCVETTSVVATARVRYPLIRGLLSRKTWKTMRLGQGQKASQTNTWTAVLRRVYAAKTQDVLELAYDICTCRNCSSSFFPALRWVRRMRCVLAGL